MPRLFVITDTTAPNSFDTETFPENAELRSIARYYDKEGIEHHHLSFYKDDDCFVVLTTCNSTQEDINSNATEFLSKFYPDMTIVAHGVCVICKVEGTKVVDMPTDMTYDKFINMKFEYKDGQVDRIKTAMFNAPLVEYESQVENTIRICLVHKDWNTNPTEYVKKLENTDMDDEVIDYHIYFENFDEGSSIKFYKDEYPYFLELLKNLDKTFDTPEDMEAAIDDIWFNSGPWRADLIRLEKANQHTTLDDVNKNMASTYTLHLKNMLIGMRIFYQNQVLEHCNVYKKK